MARNGRRHIKGVTKEQVERDYLAGAITKGIEQCQLLVEKIGEEIGDPHRDQKIFCHLRDLSNVIAFLIGVMKKADRRAQDHEDRLEKLERDFEEWKKSYPIGNGK